MDYVKFFGFQYEPFQNDLDGRLYFEGSSQRRARMHLSRAVQQRKGLALLLGGPGLGKTTLAHHLLRDLDSQKFAAHLLLSSHRECAHGWFLPQLARAYGVPQPSARVPELIDQIYEQLLAVKLAGRHPVLFVDEAQLLGEPQTLEEFRALLNLAHDGQRIFSLVLIGMEELGGVMALDPSLAQRVDVRVQLAAFSAAETGAYLAYRLVQAGGSTSLLAPAAVDALYLYSGGVLRVLNTLADNALFEAALEECPTVGVDHVEAAAEQLDLRPGTAAPLGGEAFASFHVVSSETAAARIALQPVAFEPSPPAPANDDPLFGETSAVASGSPAQADDWLEPVAPVLDAVLRSFDDEAATEVPASGPSALIVADVQAGDEGSVAGADDPLEWSLLDLSPDPIEIHPPELPRAEALASPSHRLSNDDSMTNLSFSDGLGLPDVEPGELELEDVLDEIELEPSAGAEPSVIASAAARSKGPRIDLPEDDDLDSLFDDIQIDG